MSKLTHKPFSNDPLSVFQVMVATLKKMKATSLKCLLEVLFMMSGFFFFPFSFSMWVLAISKLDRRGKECRQELKFKEDGDAERDA